MALENAFNKIYTDKPLHESFLRKNFNKNAFHSLPADTINTFSKLVYNMPNHVGKDHLPETTNSLNHLFRKHNQYSNASFEEYKENVFPYMEKNSRNFRNVPFKRNLTGDYVRQIKKLKNNFKQ